MLKKSSVSIAKERLKNLVITDRANFLPESQDIICRELFTVLSKHIQITEDDFRIEIHRTNIQIYFTGEIQ